MADEKDTVSRKEYERLEARLREAERKNRELEDDNAQYRRDKRKAKERIAELEEQADLGDGQVVAEQKDLDELKAYRELTEKGTVEALETELKAGKDAQTAIAEREAEAQITKAFELAGMKASVGVKLPGAKDLIFETKKSKDDNGDDLEVAMVRTAKDQAPVPLDEYAEEHWEDFLPALLEDGESGGSSRRPTRDEGVRIPRQTMKRGPRGPVDGVEKARENILSDANHASQYGVF